MEHFSLGTYCVIAILLAITGVAAGSLGTFFGVGGGTIVVPVLLLLYRFLGVNPSVNVHQAIAVSLVLVTINSCVAGKKHHELGNLSMPFFKSWAWWLFIGTLIGAIALAYASAFFLKLLFTLYLFAAFVYQIFKKNAAYTDAPTADALLPQGIIRIAGGIIIGALSLLLGLAGGTFTTPFLTGFNYPLKRAMAISVTSGIIVGCVGTVAAIINGLGQAGRIPFSLGYVDVITAVIIAPFVVLGSPWGIKLSSRVSDKLLKCLYAAFLLILTTYMALALGFGF